MKMMLLTPGPVVILEVVVGSSSSNGFEAGSKVRFISGGGAADGEPDFSRPKRTLTSG